MLFTTIAISLYAISVASALVFTFYFLSKEDVKDTIIDKLPETDMATINDVINKTDCVESPITVKVKAKQRNGTTKNVTFRCTKTNVYRNQKIRIK